MTSKQVLRQQISSTLHSLDANSVKIQSAKAAQSLRNHLHYKQSRAIAFYMHMDQGELQTLGMIANAFQDGKKVFLPNIIKYSPGESHPWFPNQKTHLRMLEVPDFDSVLALEPRGKYKLKEPTTGLDCMSAACGGLDLIVLPGVGFTATGARLGHGAGFYDSFINEHEHRKHSTPKLIGVGLQEQLVEPPTSLPMAPHDKMLDAVILADSVYNCS